jgi:hypothetical protein
MTSGQSYTFSPCLVTWNLRPNPLPASDDVNNGGFRWVCEYHHRLMTQLGAVPPALEVKRAG